MAEEVRVDLHVHLHGVESPATRYLIALAEEILGAVVTEPGKLAELTAKLKASADALKAATPST
jgi:hypothetical protein